MHDLGLRADVRRRRERGDTLRVIASDLGMPLSTAHRWTALRTATDVKPPQPCRRCSGQAVAGAIDAAYAYLFGQYLGDGHLVTSARIPTLRIYACRDYAAIVDRIVQAVTVVRGARPGLVSSSKSDQMITVQSYWMHWPCLLPQHGPGRKHERTIKLTSWQQTIVNEYPWPLIRGLVHSDGCRAVNRVVARGKSYAYPRYFFANESSDILAIMGAALDRVGVSWRYNRPNSISIARRASVAVMDEHVGPKH